MTIVLSEIPEHELRTFVKSVPLAADVCVDMRAVKMITSTQLRHIAELADKLIAMGRVRVQVSSHSMLRVLNVVDLAKRVGVEYFPVEE